MGDKDVEMDDAVPVTEAPPPLSAPILDSTTTSGINGESNQEIKGGSGDAMPATADALLDAMNKVTSADAGNTSINPAAASGPPAGESLDESKEPDPTMRKGPILVPNEQTTKALEEALVVREGERGDALVLAQLDQCTLGQVWALFNGKLEKGRILKIDWISDWLLLVECVDEKACNDAMDLLTRQYPSEDLIPREENEGPAIWRARNGYLDLRRATFTDVKPPGFKKKSRGGRKVKEYRGDVNWCREQGLDTNFATKLALKAQAHQQWEAMTDVTDEQKYIDMTEKDIVSSNHLLDMLSKKDEKIYDANELKGKGVPPVPENAPPGAEADPYFGKGGQPSFGNGGPGKGGSQWQMGPPGAPIKDQNANQELAGFLDFIQNEPDPNMGPQHDYHRDMMEPPPSHYRGVNGPFDNGETGPFDDRNDQYNQDSDPYATPHQRMDLGFERGHVSRVGQKPARNDDLEEFITSKRETHPNNNNGSYGPSSRKTNRGAERADPYMTRNNRQRGGRDAGGEEFLSSRQSDTTGGRKTVLLKGRREAEYGAVEGVGGARGSSAPENAQRRERSQRRGGDPRENDTRGGGDRRRRPVNDEEDDRERKRRRR